VAYQDRTLTCVECGQGFIFSADDQAYHAQKGYTNEPKRCPTCRQSRRDQRYSGGYSSGGGYGGGGGGGYRREMYPVICAQCGKETEVPFQPRGDRPVYCRDCFDRQGMRTRR
jgi:CxxC-x17-CxxC domain-containing protein